MTLSQKTLAFSQMTDEELSRTLKDYQIGLTVEEARKVEDMLGRPPTITEAIVWGIQGSEHCSYKSSRIHLKTLPTKAPNVMIGPGEDSGIVELAVDKTGQKYGIIMAHESHNHPSQIVPYEGAATGVGGIVRDIVVMGGKPIAIADPLRFGEISRPQSKRIAKGVVTGIAGYGNPLGVPTIAGDVSFDDSFNGNCLVNVVALGVLREDEIIHSYAPENAEGFDIIVVGKPTDRSGMGGASMSSGELDDADQEAKKSAVQEPNPFLERHLLESTQQLFAKLKASGHIGKVAFKDMGAGGIVCASVEQVEPAGFGADIDLAKVHTALENLPPWVIACAETQERLCWICDPSLTEMILNHYNEEWDLPGVSVGAKASCVGKVTRGNYVVRYKDEIVIDAPASLITKGLLYERPYQLAQKNLKEPEFEMPNLEEMLLKILASENVASRLPVFERYDKVVQGQTIFEPGVADAGLIAPFRNRDEVPELHYIGAALSVDANPRYNLISPYWGAVNAVVESMRNVVAIGATPWAATDCLNYGNPEKPEQMAELVEGIRGMKEALEGVGHLAFPGHPLPVVSGNVSLYNESKYGSVAPSPVIGMLGRIDDIRKAITMEFKQPGNAIYLLGPRRDECGGSEYYRQMGFLGANVPQPDFARVRKGLQFTVDAIQKGLIVAAHDISEGGMAACIVEMMLGGRGKGKYGAEVDLSELGELRSDKKLFSESGGFVFEVSDETAFLELAKLNDVLVFRLGKVQENADLVCREKGQQLVHLSREELLESWLYGLRNQLQL